MPLVLHPPVEAPIVRPFAYAGSPFAAGLHRGVDFGAAAGVVVRAPCSGRLVWAGRTALTLVCTGRRVTLVDFVARVTGGSVHTGEAVGAAGFEPLHLGVRRPGDPFGYEDPERYLKGEPPAAGPPPVLLRPWRLAPPPRAPAPNPRPAPALAPPLAPVLAWAGLAAALLGAAGGRAISLRRRRAASTEDGARTRFRRPSITG